VSYRRAKFETLDNFAGDAGESSRKKMENLIWTVSGNFSREKIRSNISMRFHLKVKNGELDDLKAAVDSQVSTREKGKLPRP
jgi:hypothetical protein